MDFLATNSSPLKANQAGGTYAETAAKISQANRYLRRHQLFPPRIIAAPHPDLALVVVIPCYNELELEVTLGALWACRRPECAVEVIVVINASQADSPAVQSRNQQTCRQALAWAAEHRDPRLAFHVLHFPDLDARHAGAGLARKLGMDEAVVRLHAAGRPKGVIVSLDADCRCDPNYLERIEAHFRANPAAPGAMIYFEHPLAGNSDRRLDEGILYYELYLRYYVQGLRFSGFPHAFHTPGSCMTVRCDAYERQGGMNRRQAGEDFYFLQKIIPLGGFTEINDTRVIPSARASDRVPFGTGRAQREWLSGTRQEYRVESPQVFLALKALFDRVDDLYAADPEDPLRNLGDLPEAVKQYLALSGFAQKLREMQRNTASAAAFRKRFFQWFTAFRVMKFNHWAAQEFHPEEPVQAAALRLLGLMGQQGRLQDRRDPDTEVDAGTLLLHYRRMERKGWPPAAAS